MTTSHDPETRDYRLLIGLVAGAALGAGLGMLLASQTAAGFRKRVAASAKDLGKTASDRYLDARARVGAVATEYTSKGRAIRDDLADTVIKGARTVERYAADAKTDDGQAAPDRSVS
ncbi:MAG TPA: hypothetical protein VGK32_22740 [Vicinamibacterales bacterium]|jgi:gas vesicle protein